MIINENDIIQLEDGKKYLVIKIKEVDGTKYAYLVNDNDNQNDCFVIIDNDTIKEIENFEACKQILKLMFME